MILYVEMKLFFQIHEKSCIFLKVVRIPWDGSWVLLLFVAHISIILSYVQALYNNRAVTILIFRWSSSVWQSYEPAISWIGWEESDLCIDDSNKPVEHYERSLDRLQFASASIYRYLQRCPHSLGLQLIVTLSQGCIISNSQWWTLAGFEPRIFFSTVTCSTIWAISHWPGCLVCFIPFKLIWRNAKI